MGKHGEAANSWRLRIARFYKSGLSAKHFIEREGISRQAFFTWKKRLGSSATAGVKAQFVEVGSLQSLLSPGPNRVTVEIVLRNGAKLLVPANLVALHLERLFGQLGEQQ